MLYIDKANGRVSAWGVAANVKSIRWKSPPDHFPAYGANLNLEGATIYAYFDDGTERDITRYCTFLPSDNTPIWTDEDYLTVTAYYTVQSGKVLSSDISLPICIPELRLVVDEYYHPLENFYAVDSPLFDPDTMPLDKSKYSLFCIWKRQDPNRGEVIVRVVRVFDENAYIYYIGGIHRIYSYGDPYGKWYVSAENTNYSNVTNYHTPLVPVTESFERGVAFYIQATVDGLTLVSNVGYFETAPVKLSYVDLPISFVDEVPTVFTKDNVRFSWGDSEPVEPIEGLNDWSAGVRFNVPGEGSDIYSEVEYTFENGDEMDFCPVKRGPGWWVEGEPKYRYTAYHCKCEGNQFNWTIIEE